ncbi:Vacuolar fusion protein CCZ1 homolog B [Linum perenne]
MGLASANTVSEGMQLCIFDLRRGQQEGQELDKILFFFPADLPFSSQLSVIGLSEGLITFTRIFSPDAACEVIEAERHSHVFYEAEPDIWMVMVVEKSKESKTSWQVDALRKVLKEVHSLFVFFHGKMRSLLERETSGGLIRSHLYPFITDYLSGCGDLNLTCEFWADFLVGKKLQLPSFHDCLVERGTVQMLTVGREAALEVQSLVRVLESSAGITSCYSLVLFQDLIVSTTLSPDDTISVFTYAVLRLTPHALLSGASSWSYLQTKTNAGSQVSALSTISNSASVSDNIYRPHDTLTSQDHVKRPLHHNRWFKGKDGFLASDIWGTGGENRTFSTPIVYLQLTEERMYLCAYQYKSLTIILLVPVSSILNGEQGVSLLKQQILENASLKLLTVEEKLSKGWGGENAYHVSGYRYLLIDDERSVSRASPPAKVMTLTKESLLAMSKVREEVDLEKKRAQSNSGVNCDKELEICVRAKNGAWVIARTSRGKELYIVLEKASETLLYASEAVEKFSNRYCGGAFSLD